MKLLVVVAILTLPAALSAQAPTRPLTQTTWRFDSLTTVDHHPVNLVGAPTLVTSDIGTVTHFHGSTTNGDALFLNALPLAGALEYTLELIFRPSAEGRPEQRILHLQEAGSNSRRMFEIRVHDNKWCVDTVAINSPLDAATPDPAHTGIMLNCDAQHLFPLDRWYVLTTTYDGKILRSYVNGILQGETSVALMPLGPGGTSVGTRYTKRDFFSGDMYAARFTPRALPVSDFLKVPANP